ncbi:DUF6415 family natural product biosynthesis protein [Streptomyces sp. NBC_00872]|uniref:DUF6415 family natural product biosynthesis protein n=1 Tax=Streptomyces sp. NBC_00872 TaxID=2903686 RepID=UPI00386D4340|nr:DUF6415 family natural product biosynthesis protein [Streptomyces sp. NBC_00872]
MDETATRTAASDTDFRPLDFPTMAKTARQVVDSGLRVPDKDLERATHLMRGYLALLIPEAETRLGRLTPAGIDEARRRQVLYWLIPLGAADTWNLPLSAVVPLGVATFLSVPPVSYTEEEKRLRWIVPLTTTCYLADPELLHNALVAGIPAAVGTTP